MFTVTMPSTTSISDTVTLHGSAVLPSDKNNAESITPKTGFIKPKTDILDTGLYLRSIPHNENAAADIKARYKSIIME